MVRDQVTILLVEFRDEVFARIAADLAATGVVVQRAGNGAEASRVHARRGISLLLVNADLPDGSGWLLGSKLRMVDPEVSIWIDTPGATSDAVSMANFIAADELIEYGGDLWRLSGEIASRLGIPREAVAAFPPGGVTEFPLPAAV